MSDCTNGELRDLLPELMHGTLDAEKRRAVEAHVAACPECREELALLRAIRPALMGGPAVNAQRIAAAVNARVPASHAPRTVRRVRPWSIAIAAAALLAVSGIGYAIALRGRSATPEVAVVHTAAPHATAGSTPAPAPAPASAPASAPSQPPQQVAVAPAHASSPVAHSTSTAENAGVVDNLSDLSDDDVRTLTASLDGLSGVPDADPAPVIDPLGASLDDNSAGGR